MYETQRLLCVVRCFLKVFDCLQFIAARDSIGEFEIGSLGSLQIAHGFLVQENLSETVNVSGLLHYRIALLVSKHPDSEIGERFKACLGYGPFGVARLSLNVDLEILLNP